MTKFQGYITWHLNIPVDGVYSQDCIASDIGVAMF